MSLRRRQRRDVNTSNMSFLDVVSCGFGAVILLLVLTLELEPGTLSRVLDAITAQAETQDHDRDTLREDSRRIQSLKTVREAELTALNVRVAELEARLQGLRAAGDTAAMLAARRDKAAEAVETVRQKLSEETRRLLSQSDRRPPPEEATIGGIPMDSEYIIFIVDTSGSMLRFAWPLVNQKVKEVLEVYPKVKGLQVMNDMGRHMFTAYQNRWIPDTPARRREVLRRLRTWQGFSNSSPVEGIVAAVEQFFSEDHKVSLYVFGDDFSGGNIDAVLATVHAINRQRGAGKPRVRVHAFGFPVLFLRESARDNRTRFAHLMRLLAEQNAGSFVGLTALEAQRNR